MLQKSKLRGIILLLLLFIQLTTAQDVRNVATQLSTSFLQLKKDIGANYMQVGQDICYRVSKDSTFNPLIPASKKIVKVMKENEQLEPSIRWQYFGTENGIMVIFPKRVNVACDTYDPRYRPWYVETVTPVPKDVVIVFDKSDSMKVERLLISKEAAKTMIGTLNPNDRVAMVVFSSQAYTPPGDETENCYADQMAYAIPSVKTYFKDYIQRITTDGSTSYIAAFNKAFSLLKTINSTSDRKKVILFLTDGEPDEYGSAILKRLSVLNAQQKNSVTILTYGLGKDIQEEEATLLKQIANMTGYNASAGDRNIGHYVKISDTKNLRYKLASYYNFFATDEILTTPIVSVPYTDFSGLGTITSVCLPVYDTTNTLRGAVCIDITLSDLTSNLETFNQGDKSYMFIIHKSGRTLLHPNLPSPGQDFNSDPIFLNITVLESDAMRNGILTQMLNPTNTHGSKTISTKILIYKGNATTDSTDETIVKANYQWKRIPHSNFILCLVQVESETSISITEKYDSSSFVYHLLDLQSNVKTCNFNGNEVTVDTSAVKLSPNAFQDGPSYIYKKETAFDLDRYNGVMQGWGKSTAIFQESVPNYVAISEEMDNFWKTKNKELVSGIEKFFFAGNNGVFRMYPGQQMAQSYDYLKRMWYIETTAFKEKLVISRSHKSDFRNMNTHTASHSLYLSSNLFGVIGADLDTRYLSVIINRTLPLCSNGSFICFIFDTSGFIIVHPLLTQSPDESHMAAMEPDIHDFLMSNGYLQKSTCTDYAWRTSYHTWKTNIQSPLDFRDRYPYVFIAPIQGTNLFICLQKPAVSSITICDSCKTADTSRCSFSRSEACYCPCYKTINFHHCNNSFKSDETSIECSKAPTANNQPLQQGSSRAQGLRSCFDFQCSDFTESWSCNFQESCQWCKSTESQQTKSCVKRSECEGLTTNPPTEGTNVSVIVAVVIVFILVIVIVVVIVIFRKKISTTFRTTFRSDDEPNYDYVLPDSGKESSSGLHNVATSVMDHYITPKPLLSANIKGKVNPAYTGNDEVVSSEKPQQSSSMDNPIVSTNQLSSVPNANGHTITNTNQLSPKNEDQKSYSAVIDEDAGNSHHQDLQSFANLHNVATSVMDHYITPKPFLSANIKGRANPAYTGNDEVVSIEKPQQSSSMDNPILSTNQISSVPNANGHTITNMNQLSPRNEDQKSYSAVIDEDAENSPQQDLQSDDEQSVAESDSNSVLYCQMHAPTVL